MAKVTVIPPRSEKPRSLRVAAYCRVSTDYSDQLHSYAVQIRNYTELIEQHEGWELVDIYADEAQSGTRMDKREDFNRMMADCRKGKIDRILVKSVSRFARNTHDCLVALRELMRLGVTVKFEEDNIDTGMLTNEMLVSISGALAQQESISISQNMKMSYKRRMEKGEFITQSAPFGYRLVNKRELEIDPEQAEIVKWIFESYLSGHGINWIARQLTLKGIKTANGRDEWDASSVAYIITNEKCVGDTLCQKIFISGFPYKSVKKRGELDQYYIESTHPAIIDRETFDRAQQFYRQKRVQRNPLPKSPISLKFKCGVCGGTLFRSRSRKRSVLLWQCKTYSKCVAECPIGSIRDSEIQAAFVRMYNKLKLHKGTILHPAAIQLDELTERLRGIDQW